VSPVFYSFSSIVKISYGWSDTFDCLRGDSELGPNKCFLEYSGSIEDLKYRGISVATFDDPMSGVVWPETLCLLGLYAAGQVILFGFLWGCTRIIAHEKTRKDISSDQGGSDASGPDGPVEKIAMDASKHSRRGTRLSSLRGSDMMRTQSVRYVEKLSA